VYPIVVRAQGFATATTAVTVPADDCGTDVTQQVPIALHAM
jgi:hypothetical protein